MKSSLTGDLLALANGNLPEAFVVAEETAQVEAQMKVMGADAGPFPGLLGETGGEAHHPKAVTLETSDDLVDQRLIKLLPRHHELVTAE